LCTANYYREHQKCIFSSTYQVVGGLKREKDWLKMLGHRSFQRRWLVMLVPD